MYFFETSCFRISGEAPAGLTPPVFAILIGDGCLQAFQPALPLTQTSTQEIVVFSHPINTSRISTYNLAWKGHDKMTISCVDATLVRRSPPIGDTSVCLPACHMLPTPTQEKADLSHPIHTSPIPAYYLLWKGHDKMAISRVDATLGRRSPWSCQYVHLHEL